jgi:magnesium chelatase subunit D
LAATLAAGRVVTGRGLLADPAVLLLGMAERAGPGMAARLAQRQAHLLDHVQLCHS